MKALHPPKTDADAHDRHQLVALDRDHPGFRDAGYRARRDTIARIALAHETGRPVPEAPYVDGEQGVWRAVLEELAPLHQDRVCDEILELQQVLPLSRERIPQLSELNPRLHAVAGFRMEPVAGLVTARTFLRWLGRRVFLSTQYVRHESRPFYTPEPDVIHELVGHAATLVHPGIAELNRVFGEAAEEADDEGMARIASLYWYTLEFGVVEQRGQLKAFGAGLLSSAGELARFDTVPELRAWDVDAIAATPYDPTDFQPVLFVAPSFTRLLCDATAWVRLGRWRT